MVMEAIDVLQLSDAESSPLFLDTQDVGRDLM